MNFNTLIFAFFIAFACLFSLKNINNVNASTNHAEIVMELNSNRVLHENNCNKKMYMASLTKIITAIVIIENCDLNEIITISKKTTGIEGSSIYLEEGEKLSEKRIVMMHYPPDVGFAELLDAYNVELCVYGHLHGRGAWNKFMQSERDLLVSADYLQFIPHAIRKDC